MFRKYIYYIILIPILIIFGFISLSNQTSEFDQDNFDFKKDDKYNSIESYINTFPSSNEADKIFEHSLNNQKILFTPQAPLAEWSDPRQQDACEEASVIMAMTWLGLEKFNTLSKAKEKIINLSAWQEENFNTYVDTSATDTNERLIKNYYKYNNAEIIKNISLDDIKKALWQEHIVLAPCDGQKLANPNFTYPGPERHMIVIHTYDEVTKEFITNDPGTKNGENYRYKENILFNAIRDYSSGNHKPIIINEKNIIVVKKLEILS
jgi:hypothetical protein